MFRRLIFKDLYTSKTYQNKIIKNFKYGFSELEKYDPLKSRKILPLLVEDPFMPYSCNLRYLKNDYLTKFYNYSKENQINDLAAFYHDKKKNTIVPHVIIQFKKFLIMKFAKI